MNDVKPNRHVVLVTQYAYDADKRLYYQFQETECVGIYEEGYAYVDADMVTHFVEMEA